MSNTVTILERVYSDKNGIPYKWERKIAEGPWEEVDCSCYPDGRPPFVIFDNKYPDWAKFDELAVDTGEDPYHE